MDCGVTGAWIDPAEFRAPQKTRNLRDLTRYRIKLVEDHNRIHNRIHKVLEDACIKFDTSQQRTISSASWNQQREYATSGCFKVDR
ncbi:MAG: IS110 family transposase [Acidobacteriota bacterium]|nr:IS110 family transposase [Acidobacteriota bacterium]